MHTVPIPVGHSMAKHRALQLSFTQTCYSRYGKLKETEEI